ncbi:synembryn-A isoform X4 [Synchiropus splendidus]|uniref:synembryn-A isoform X4 n=1 Tax=Synchiropus splendidus TaxID=270530 RepID=UPI00237DCA3E|nr:synembryn-A isoform X4 [Synchiropus splendidus]
MTQNIQPSVTTHMAHDWLSAHSAWGSTMVPDVEAIIHSINRGDQDAVQLHLLTYNTQYADCFFTESQQRKKVGVSLPCCHLWRQQKLEQFRQNKVRLSADSDSDSDLDEPDLLLRQRLAAALLGFISGPLQPPVLYLCLQTLRILSRDHRGLQPLVSHGALLTLAQLANLSCHGGFEPALDSTDGQRWGNAGHVTLATAQDGDGCRREAIKVLCNVIYNSPQAQETASALRLLHAVWRSVRRGMRSVAASSGRFYELRLLFLLTALRPELRLQLQQERGVSVLTQALEQSLEVRRREGFVVVSESSGVRLSMEASREVIEILKTLFNVCHKLSQEEPDEEDAAQYRHLAAVLRHCLLCSCEEEHVLEEVQGHAANVLSVLPLTCLDVLLSGPQRATHHWEGVDMDAVHSLLLLMERRLGTGQKLKEKLTPVLNLLTESCRVHRETRRYLRQQILPPLRDVSTRPEQDCSLRGQLVRLMTHVDTDVKHCAAELLFVLCKENVSRFVKYTGYGNAAGLLAMRGLLRGGRTSGPRPAQYSSDSDSDTEEYREAKSRINLVTGRVEAEQPDPMEGMTEEEKEEEACRLMAMIDRLSRVQIIQPMSVTADGGLAPLWAGREEEEEGMVLLTQGRKDSEIE